MFNRTRLKFRGWVDVELEAESGEKRTLQFHNAVSDNMAAAAASALAQQSAGVPTTIRLGTGALANVDDGGVDSFIALDSPLAQYFTQGESGAISLGYVLLGLKRVGTASATLTVKLYTAAGVIALDESTPVALNGLSSTAFRWAKFDFPTPVALNPGAYRIELSSSGYTYSAGVLEVQWAYDSDNPYSGGNLVYWDGGAWQPVNANTNIDGMFRAVIQTHDQMATLVGNIQSAQIDGYSKSGRYLARFLSIFGTASSAIYVGHVALEDSDGNLLAIAMVNIDKQPTEVLRIYWTIEVTP